MTLKFYINIHKHIAIGNNCFRSTKSLVKSKKIFFEQFSGQLCNLRSTKSRGADYGHAVMPRMPAHLTTLNTWRSDTS